MLKVNQDIAIDERDLVERFVRASGPGGQNVNKVSTAVELRFDVHGSQSLPAAVRARLARLAGRRLTDAGVLVIRAERFRTQERNREDARARLVDLVREATVAPKRRIPTKPSRGAKQKRLDNKTKRGHVKNLRRSKPDLG
jgi:ribosome-associated protein